MCYFLTLLTYCYLFANVKFANVNEKKCDMMLGITTSQGIIKSPYRVYVWHLHYLICGYHIF